MHDVFTYIYNNNYNSTRNICTFHLVIHKWNSQASCIFQQCKILKLNYKQRANIDWKYSSETESSADIKIGNNSVKGNRMSVLKSEIIQWNGIERRY